MIIDQACGLEEGIDSDGADKLEASFFHILGNQLRQGCLGWGLFVIQQVILNGFAIDKGPDIVIKAAKILLNLEKGLGIGSGRKDFQAVADNGWILQDFLQVLIGHFCYLMVIIVMKGLLEGGPFVENGFPRKACLIGFKAEQFKEGLLIMERAPPLFIMVSNIEGVGHFDPATTFGHRNSFQC